MSQEQKLNQYGRIDRGELHVLDVEQKYRGRGALTNPDGRFEAQARTATDDGWSSDEARPLKTELIKETPRTIITYNQSPDIRFDRSINPYRGCEHGCVYCFARPSHSYQGLSAGLDFESKLFYKPDGLELLKRELSKPGYVPRPIALGVNTDAYQPIEKQLRLTRQFLEILAEHNHPVTLLTKSSLIERDIDLIGDLATKNLCRVGVSVTTLDPKLARLMEPRAAAPHRRLKTISALTHANIPVTVMMAPIIPALNEAEIERLLKEVADLGADTAGYVLLRLPFDVKDLMHEWLYKHYPDRAARIINLLRGMRGGKDYDADWQQRGRGQGVHANLIAQRFRRARRTFGLASSPPRLRTDLFSPPIEHGGQYRFQV